MLEGILACGNGFLSQTIETPVGFLLFAFGVRKAQCWRKQKRSEDTQSV